ncbi:MAG TPA: TIGR00730 family Rossman fold protein [Candidatus Paceibacterota bacterium]|nr:TIGR00730 family Rossman fold protein [Candidatus Paceibacterota bacterium]
MADEIKTTTELSEKMSTHLARLSGEGQVTVPENVEPLICKPRQLEPWRVFKIMSEFVEGFELLQKYTLAATFFGSTRAALAPEIYQAATDLSAKLAKRGFAIITGGSAGIMEAANKGAYEAGGSSVGLNIKLDSAQPMNRYVTEQNFFDHFFVRKVMLTFASEVYVYFPGGFGTLDEFFEIVTLVQTKKIKQVPIVCYGKAFWNPLLEHFRKELKDTYHTIDDGDMELFHVVDSVDEAFEYITKNVTC